MNSTSVLETTEVCQSVAGREFETESDAARGIIWTWYAPQGRACFTINMLEAILKHQTLLKKQGRQVRASHPWYVVGALTPDVFNYGGDLMTFKRLIELKDRNTLLHYARVCVDVVYNYHHGMGIGLNTIACVQGEALGGGFEAALACQHVVAEEHARFGLPECVFNLFPGMGAYSFLVRKAGFAVAKRLFQTGEILTAQQAHELGLVDVVVPRGEGPEGVARFIHQRNKRLNTLDAFNWASNRVQPVRHEELSDIVELWVETALRLEPAELRRIEMLYTRQTSKITNKSP